MRLNLWICIQFFINGALSQSTCPSVSLSSNTFISPPVLQTTTPQFRSGIAIIAFTMTSAVAGRKITFTTKKPISKCPAVVVTPGTSCAVTYEITIANLANCFTAITPTAYSTWPGTKQQYTGTVDVLVDDTNTATNKIVSNTVSFNFDFIVQQDSTTILLSYIYNEQLYNKVTGNFEIKIKSILNYQYYLSTDLTQVLVRNYSFVSVNLKSITALGTNCGVTALAGTDCEQILLFEVKPSACQTKFTGTFDITAQKACRRDLTGTSNCIIMANTVPQEILLQSANLCETVSGQLVPRTVPAVVNLDPADNASNLNGFVAELDVIYFHLVAPTGLIVTINSFAFVDLCITNSNNAQRLCLIQNGATTTLGQKASIGLQTNLVNPQNTWVKMTSTVSSLANYGTSASDGLFLNLAGVNYVITAKVTYTYSGVNTFKQLVKRESDFSAEASSVTVAFTVRQTQTNRSAQGSYPLITLVYAVLFSLVGFFL